MDVKGNSLELTTTDLDMTVKSKVVCDGIEDGVWEFTDENKSFVHLEIDLEDYYGVAIRQNVDHLLNASAICFSAVKESYQYGGEAVWLYKLDNSTTGIHNVERDNVNTANEPSYNLAGQRVSKDYKGIIIQNGKKFIKK